MINQPDTFYVLDNVRVVNFQVMTGELEGRISDVKSPFDILTCSNVSTIVPTSNWKDIE
jgi:hypothetical protein